jgi:recombination protein RecR
MAGGAKAIDRLVEALSRLPGIGGKTASRLAYYLLRTSADEAETLAEALVALHRDTVRCSVCCNISETDPCAICSDDTRDANVLCVVEEPLDVAAIERTGQFRGRFHVLHGHISPMDRIGPEDLCVEELVRRLESGGARELILATNPTMEGDATARYLADRLSSFGAVLSRLALGLPRGGDLEYADEVTLAEALAGRRPLH